MVLLERFKNAFAFKSALSRKLEISFWSTCYQVDSHRFLLAHQLEEFCFETRVVAKSHTNDGIHHAGLGSFTPRHFMQ